MRSPGNAPKPNIWPVSLSQRGVKRRKIYRVWPQSNKFWRWSRYISMYNFRLFPPCVLRQMSGNLSGRTDEHAVKRSRLAEWTNGPGKRVFRASDGRTDGKPENIMPLAPKGEDITSAPPPIWNCMKLTPHLEISPRPRQCICRRVITTKPRVSTIQLLTYSYLKQGFWTI